MRQIPHNQSNPTFDHNPVAEIEKVPCIHSIGVTT